MPSSPFSPVPSEALDVNISSTDMDLTVMAYGCARFLYVGTPGTGGVVIVKFKGSSTPHTFKNVPAGSYLHGEFSTVVKTSTTASDMIALA